MRERHISRQEQMRFIGHYRIAEDHELARKIVRVFSCYRNDELPEGTDCYMIGFPCAHSDSCSRTVKRIQNIITADRLAEREMTGRVIMNLHEKLSELKKNDKTIKSKKVIEM